MGCNELIVIYNLMGESYCVPWYRIMEMCIFNGSFLLKIYCKDYHIVIIEPWVWQVCITLMYEFDTDSGLFGDVKHHFDGLVQDCSNSSALAMELLRSCTKPSI